MPRFVLLYHNCPPHYERTSHWDLMLEVGDSLRTWTLAELPCDWKDAHAKTAFVRPQCPPLAATSSVVAEELGQHRREYLEFEGMLSGHRGSVVRVAAGSYELLNDATADSWQVQLVGDLSGRIRLTREGGLGEDWTLSTAD